MSDNAGRKVFLLLLSVIGVLSYAVALQLSLASRGTAPSATPPLAPAAHARAAIAAEVRASFEQAVVMLHAKQFEHATAVLHRVLELAPDMPEAHVNMGYALIGLERFAAARDFFQSALALRASQTNAYYGLAMAYEGLADVERALGAMRTYVHLTRGDDAHKRRARAAIWEWQQRLAQTPRDKTARAERTP